MFVAVKEEAEEVVEEAEKVEDEAEEVEASALGSVRELQFVCFNIFMYLP